MEATLCSPLQNPFGTQSILGKVGGVFDKGSTDAVLGLQDQAASVENQSMLCDGSDLLDLLIQLPDSIDDKHPPTDLQIRPENDLSPTETEPPNEEPRPFPDSLLDQLLMGLSATECGVTQDENSQIQLPDMQDLQDLFTTEQPPAKRPCPATSPESSSPVTSPGSVKDGQYIERRRKNNVASKRSRQIRKTKESEMTQTVKQLEEENDSLRQQAKQLEKQCQELKQKLIVKLKH
eukprot:m.306262 g.306262  ORF g.306262 m.306262 type:complete len:235 (+) comp41100_c0_seq1:299-1003(+)